MVSSKFTNEDRLYMASRLKDARQACGLTQGQLAEKLGQTQSFVAKYETRERSLEFFELLTLCDALNISVKQLVHKDKQDIVCGPQRGETL